MPNQSETSGLHRKSSSKSRNPPQLETIIVAEQNTSARYNGSKRKKAASKDTNPKDPDDAVPEEVAPNLPPTFRSSSIIEQLPQFPRRNQPSDSALFQPD